MEEGLVKIQEKKLRLTTEVLSGDLSSGKLSIDNLNEIFGCEETIPTKKKTHSTNSNMPL